MGEENAAAPNVAVDVAGGGHGKSLTGKNRPRAGHSSHGGGAPPNFEFHGKQFHFAENSLYCLGVNNPLRQKIVRLITWNQFDRFILFLICANSVFLAMYDYTVIDPATGEPRSTGYDSIAGIQADGTYIAATSSTNLACEVAELVFTWLFIAEASLKIMGMGFCMDEGSYLRDGWNWLDWIVVVSGIVQLIPGMPSVAILRTFRVLRPLRSLTTQPRLKLLVTALLGSLPALGSVALLLFFAFTIFGILGLQMWTGLLHFRCRLTPYPLQLFGNHTAADYIEIVYRDCAGRDGVSCPYWSEAATKCAGEGATAFSYSGDCYVTSLMEGQTAGVDGKIGTTDDVFAHACETDDGLKILQADNKDWEPLTSPWHTKRLRCVWPVNMDDTRVCGEKSGAGYMCPGIENRNVGYDDGQDPPTWCGSNYDHYGHRRFAEDAMKWEGNYIGDLNFGLTNFDNILSAFLTIFQSITQEGWIDITYQVQDAFNPTVGALYFMMLILFGSFFMLNLTLAVIWDNFSAGHEAMEMLYEDEEDQTEEDKQAKSDAHEKWRVTSWAPDNPFIRCMFKFVNNDGFESFIILHILGNTVVLSMDSYPMDPAKAEILDIVNFYFTAVFFLEMVLKWIGLGIRRYMQSAFNRFDFLIVAVSVLETIVMPPVFLGVAGSGDASGNGAFSALRTFRLFRLFKLARSWTSLQELLATLAATMGDVSNFAVLLILFMYIYSLIGMQFFANRFVYDNYTEEPVKWDDIRYSDDTQVYRARAHYDNLLWAYTTTFQILSGENWNTVMYDGWRSIGSGAAIYYLFLVLIGDWLVLNLFMAILLGNFENPPDKDDEDELTEGLMKVLSSFVGFFIGGKKNETAKVEPQGQLEQKAEAAEEAEDKVSECSTDGVKDPAVMNGVSCYIWSMDSPFRKQVFWFCEHDWWENFILLMIMANSVALAIENPLWEPTSTAQSVMTFLDFFMTVIFFWEMAFKWIALGVFMHEHSYFRSGWNTLDGVIVITSLASVVMQDSSMKALRVLRLARVLRVLRLVTRNAALQLVVSALLRAIPGIVNVTLVCSMFFLIFAIVGMNYFKAAFWTCGGDGFEGASDEIVALIETPVDWDTLSPAFQTELVGVANEGHINAALMEYTEGSAAVGVGWDQTVAGWDAVSGLAWVKAAAAVNAKAFSEAGVCTAAAFALGADGPNCGAPPDGGTQDPLMKGKPTAKDYCLYLGYEWGEVVFQKFDNVIFAFMALFEMSTTEGWVDIMLAAVDSTGIDQQPKENFNTVPILFFIAFIIVGSFFIMNVFVGVVCATFNQTKAELGNKYNLMTEAQAEWARFSMQVFTAWQPVVRHKQPTNPIRKFCFKIVQWKHFDTVIMGCILLNTVVMAIQFWGAGYGFTVFIEGSNFFFGALFTLEAIFKLTAYKKRYFTSGWNTFDFCIVVGTLLGIFMKYVADLDIGSVATIIRTFRVGRILRLVKGLTSLRILFATLVMTLPSLWNVGAIVCMLFYMFAILGVQLFATVQYDASGGGAYNEHGNFRTFSTAFLTLVRCSTGENWNGMMYDMLATPDGCLMDPVYDPESCGFNDKEGCYPLQGCGLQMALPFWVAFTLTVTYVMLNLFIGIVLDGFGESSSQEYSSLSSDHKELFLSLWQDFDPDAERSITVNELEKFVMLLPPPMGYEITRTTRHYEIKAMITGLKLPTYAIDDDMRVLFSDVASAFAKRVYECEKGDEFEELDDEMELEIKRKRSTKEGKKITLAGKGGAHGYHRHYAVVKLLLTFQTFKFRQNLCERVKHRAGIDEIGGKGAPARTEAFTEDDKRK